MTELPLTVRIAIDMARAGYSDDAISQALDVLNDSPPEPRSLAEPKYYRRAEGLFALYPYETDPNIYWWTGRTWDVWDNTHTPWARDRFVGASPEDPDSVAVRMPAK